MTKKKTLKLGLKKRQKKKILRMRGIKEKEID